ncbi:hypothetical protein QEZ54_08705 [Catellatospora sp. KI3]|uniref:hypothetical protein n=1 Tax=Catellatospora sp. KI3 TaxID=3041620 RepID=UPI002482C3AC|nr:hypothetical protein [Catellatospora sp. KI3]MDI1461042.1 hypothetical protein [Catellatospora sp. KI3]
MPTVAYDPTTHLVKPEPADDSVSSGFVNVTSVLDYVSLTAWLNEAIEGLTGCDVLGTMVSPLSGDWEKVSTYGTALTNLSRCLRGIADNVDVANVDLDLHWNGNAADAAYVYFSSASRSLSAHADAVERAAGQYQKLALDVWHFTEVLKGFLQSIVDQALLVLVFSAAGTALLETGVGAVAGYALAALELVNLIKTINKASAVVQAANVAFQTSFSTLTGIFKEVEDLGSIPTVNTVYDHPTAK